MDSRRVSINSQFGHTPSCTPIISSQSNRAGCCSPPHPFSLPFVSESCLCDLSDKQHQNCPVCKKQGHLFSICCQRFHTENWWDVSFIRGMGQYPELFCSGTEHFWKLAQFAHTYERQWVCITYNVSCIVSKSIQAQQHFPAIFTRSHLGWGSAKITIFLVGQRLRFCLDYES